MKSRFVELYEKSMVNEFTAQYLENIINVEDFENEGKSTAIDLYEILNPKGVGPNKMSKVTLLEHIKNCKYFSFPVDLSPYVRFFIEYEAECKIDHCMNIVLQTIFEKFEYNDREDRILEVLAKTLNQMNRTFVICNECYVQYPNKKS